MKKTLVIMAAGLGSRFGAGEGKKQVTPVDEDGRLIIDYSVYDAVRAGFEKVVFVIRPENKEMFHESIGSRVEPFIEVDYAFQTLDVCLPEGFTAPEGRKKPWGTGHAALCAREQVEDGFAIINADDFYGRSAFVKAAAFLDASASDTEHAMVGYRLKNTMTPNGSVARGICSVDENNMLLSVTERTNIFAQGEDGVNRDKVTGEETFIPGDTPVSMNLWVFKHSVFPILERRFAEFLRESLPANPLKGEYYLPLLSETIIEKGLGTIEVLPTDSTWFGMTYLEDLESTKAGIRALKDAGEYPEKLWENA